MEDMHIIKEEGTITIKTKGEGTTREIGKNMLMVGFYIGVLGSLYNHRISPVEIFQTRNSCIYRFRIEKAPFSVKSKEKSIYNELNQHGMVKGFALKTGLEKKIFRLKENNRIYFRGTPIVPIENTLYHLIGREGALLDRLAGISYEYFSRIIDKKSTDTQKLTLLKNLLQSMGWGIIRILSEKKRIILDIRNPPYGLQPEEDNWDFLFYTVLGYLWLIDKKLRLKDTRKAFKHITVTYS